MRKEDIKILFDKYLQNKCSEEDLRLLLSYFKDENNREVFDKLLEDFYEVEEESVRNDLFFSEREKSFDTVDLYLEKLIHQEKRHPKYFIRTIKAWHYAATLAAVLLLFFFYRSYLPNDDENLDVFSSNYTSVLSNAIYPEVHLSNVVFGQRELLRVGSVRLLQLSKNYLKVVESISEARDSLAYNSLKLTVAPGQCVMVELADGTRVTVNSASDFYFPLLYQEKQRTVELDGEAYFDVASNKDVPFFVKSLDQVVQVYGTRFNVKNYKDDEVIKTSLIEGKVSVRKRDRKTNEEYILSPGEQIRLERASKEIELERFKTEKEILSWTKGEFAYDNVALKVILKDLARWYNVEVDWKTIPDLRFQGIIPQKYALEKALNLLGETGGIQIEMKENLITVKP
ncbi:FecR domain-containing protein [Sphingobacterium sp. UT-1RO-CII-1]|uniref:FecR family protein n=1 Tax=Sphingobacterium sp. UT-1RO-CII-1 TaxID=2995225 RepID=UPI00227B8225|nr:FecR domain-containing protein [Sphingobacterium sp. UT-1RO-CII-1]MCY4780031.1 FecR domain-containing protein [Sphingobacterium sp. UT-1RO-CII-1]